MKELYIMERTHCLEDGCTLDQCHCSKQTDISTQTYKDAAVGASTTTLSPESISLETAIQIDEHLTKLEESRKLKSADNPETINPQKGKDTSKVQSVPNTEKAVLSPGKLNWADDTSVSTIDAAEREGGSVYDALTTSSMSFEESKNQYAIMARDMNVTPTKREILLLKQDPKDRSRITVKRVKSMPKKETLAKGFVKIPEALEHCINSPKIQVQAEDPSDPLAQDTAVRLGSILAFGSPQRKP
jgi:hypothetical protein